MQALRPAVLLFAVHIQVPAQLLDRGHGFQRPRDNVAGAGFLRLVGETRFEQLGVRENDAELIVQPMEEPGQILR